MAKTLFLKKTENENGIIFAEFHKLSSDGDMLGYHRLSFAPGADVDSTITSVNASMATDKYDPITAADVAQIKNATVLAWTPENIAPVTAQVVEAIKEQQAAITEAAAKKAEAEAAAAQEIEDAKARETAANEAKALAEAAEAAAKEAQAKADAALKAAAALAAPPPEPVDACIDNLQIRLALNAAGLRDSVEAAVAASDQSVKDWWAYAKRFLRHNPMVLAMGQALGQTDEQLDQLWALAATL